MGWNSSGTAEKYLTTTLMLCHILPHLIISLFYGTPKRLILLTFSKDF